MRHRWDAVSGARGFRSREFQDRAGEGPIPGGRYRIAQSRLQNRRDVGFLDQVLGYLSLVPRLVGREHDMGTWPTGDIGWGRHRVWADPYPGSDTLGRKNFSIHGGWFPGSAG